ncbi:PucR family transcriptional regulator [Paramicrobacterium agarici]|uniref:DNA-binding PucR family transcriptional regulator n=1 Tax=Paramicrobacterium agarici TaxID=630514 RepID=A0A2A9E180_9MICO|nr:PucR family transcriptional regulator [Microbacterium agarici]PFG31949.1 DNA-binding PucR family transcriptional regulator [Microbacterium agarici]
MGVTVADLVSDPSFELRCLAGHELLGRQIRWVHVSEIGDPSPWLSGNELLLTTGLVERTDEEVFAFFDALAATRVAAVGYGTGFVHDDVPPVWICAALRYGIPVLEIPLSTPYIAIAEFVSRKIAVEELSQVNRMLDVQQRLAQNEQTEALVRDSLSKLARVLDATVVVQYDDGSLDVIDGVVSLDASDRDTVVHEMQVHRGSARHSTTTAIGDLYIHAAKADGATLGVAKRSRYSPVEQNIIGSVATALRLSAESAVSDALRLREALFQLVIVDEMPPEPHVIDVLLSDIENCAIVHASSDGAASQVLADALQSTMGKAGLPCLVCATSSAVIAVVPDAAIDSLRSSVTALMSDNENARLWSVGVSSGKHRHDVMELLREAAVAHRIAARGVKPAILEYSDVVTVDSAQMWMREAADEPLLREWRKRLERASGREATHVSALRAFLRCNGAREKAARSLGIHRQTLNARLVEVEKVLGVSLDEPRDRVLLWLAFEALEERRA